MDVQALGARTAATAATSADPAVSEREIIHYGGRRFSCSPEMARIFLEHAREVIESGDQQLVPLLHSGGIELLLVSRTTPYSLLGPSGM